MAETAPAAAAPKRTAPGRRGNGKGTPTVFSMLQAYKEQIQAALPRHMSVDRMVRIAMTEIRRTPQLMKCDPVSLFGAVIQAAQLGLEPGINGQAWLIPFWNSKRKAYEVQFIPGYKGLMDLARRSGRVKKIVARVVREGDEFDYRLGTDEYIKHVPRSGPDAPLYAAYAVATLDDGTQQFEVMLRPEVDAIRKRSKAGENGPWVTDYEEMAKKTVVRRLCKYLPASVELATAVSLDEMAEAGVSQGNPAVIDVVPEQVDDGESAEEPESDPQPETGGAGKTAKVREKLKRAAKQSEQAPEPAPEQPKAEPPAEADAQATIDDWGLPEDYGAEKQGA